MSAAPWKPPLYGKQWDVYDAREQIILVDGSRWGGKSVAISHKVCNHLWGTPGANFAIFAKSVKLAKDGGSWQMLLENILPLWFNANLLCKDGVHHFEMLSRTAEGLPGAKVDANTRTAYFDVRNWYGGKSRCWLFSINNENEIEEKVKNKNFSGMWFIELSMWKERKLLPVTINSLRMPGLGENAEKYFLWIGDTNPDEVLGRNSWIYQVFYVERNKPAEVNESDEEKEMLRELYRQMRVITMHWRENPHMTRQQQARLYATCRGDKALKEAYYEGVWGQGGFQTKHHFRHLFNAAEHVVIGDTEECDQIDVAESTTTLKSGWDIGSVNHACVLLDKWYRRVGEREIACYSALDEIVHIGEGQDHDDHVQLAQFTEWVLIAMGQIDKRNGRTFNWDHFADDSALNVFRPNSENPYDYLEIAAASKGKIGLQGVYKPARSRRTRIRMISLLLQQKRLFISTRCRLITAALINLSSSKTQYIVRDEHLHVFDALSYPIFAEMQGEFIEEAFDPVATTAEEKEMEQDRKIISI